MGKFIIVTFGFLAFALYELSGGSEFVSVADEKRVMQEALLEEEEVQTPQAQRELGEIVALASPVTEIKTVARVVPAASVAEIASTPSGAPAHSSVNASASAQSNQDAPSIQQATNIAITAQASGDFTRSFESALETALSDVEEQPVGDDVQAQASQSIASSSTDSLPTDIRRVTAARVNMREGPGRNFAVVAKLSAGDSVEILQDPGLGWVKLKMAETGRVGWMADFLLTASNI